MSVQSTTLERAFDYTGAKGPVILLTEHQTPAAIRRTGEKRLTARLNDVYAGEGRLRLG
ncbi:hypothetical protein [Streptomyces mirabilis]|uniref:hypothetical protein n=1 Tax=Streptomyces mirabilis TaxID=68239 RepID=UPI002257BE82|nr:hypothetical protein [Streptomyces mirabilis]MCX4430357.1 hypothetical protein [Streptomyces mirabilis]